MQTDLQGAAAQALQEPIPAELSHAGAVVDRAIEYMLGQRISAIAIASALLGGSLGLLARSMEDEAILQVLHNAIASVEAGDLRDMNRPGLASADQPAASIR